MALRVYNTLSRQKEDFQTVSPGKVSMYLCGPTVYKPAHIGHMVGPVIFDTIKKYLAYSGYAVKFVINITDVDDKLIVKANEKGTTVKALAEQMTADYFDNLKLMGVDSIEPKVPPLLIEKVPPVRSSMEILPSLAFWPNSAIFFSMSAKLIWSALRRMGTTRPRGELTAIPMSK